MKDGIQIIADERKRQIEELGWTLEKQDAHPDWYSKSQLALAGAMYAIPDEERGELGKMVNEECISLLQALWPWSANAFKPSPENRVRELAKAGALIAAEIDRLNRIEVNL